MHNENLECVYYDDAKPEWSDPARCPPRIEPPYDLSPTHTALLGIDIQQGSVTERGSTYPMRQGPSPTSSLPGDLA